MSEQEDIRLEDLSEGQQEVAALIGPENFRKLMEVYGGAYLYIPKTDRLERMERNERIRAEFDGYNFRELARKCQGLNAEKSKIVFCALFTKAVQAP